MTPGKHIDSHTWVHISALSALPQATQECIAAAAPVASIAPDVDFNVVKLDKDCAKITFLDYPAFYDIAFPTLYRYWTVDIEEKTYRYRTYEDSMNPPVLHRKELLLLPSEPRRGTYSELTKNAELIGLFDDPCRIGFKRSWEQLLAQKGYRVVGHELIPIGNDETPPEIEYQPQEVGVIERHRTALYRYTLSAPIQTLHRFGFLDGTKSVFDYGCGHGDDIKGLLENDVNANGWDPYHAPDEELKPAHVVNLGFVINVIEDIDERIQALIGAYTLANEFLVVSAMLANQNAMKGTPYADGILTTRNTFQKYYTQNELKNFIFDVLDETPIPIGPGIFYVFKDKDAEQRFLYQRQTNRRNILRISDLTRPKLPTQIARADRTYEEHKVLLDQLWECCISLGRTPHQTEVYGLDNIKQAFGSLPAALRFIKSRKENADIIMEMAQQNRVNDLIVFFALLHFQQRMPYTHLEERLQRDIKIFFGSYRHALNAGRDLLFQINDVCAIGSACKSANEHGIGHLDEGKSLQLHTSMISQLPPILRIYIGCGVHLYGDTSCADLIKVHINSGKLTLLSFDDFEGKGLPRMIQRVKLNLRELDLDIFDYGDEYKPPYLFHKSRFINEEFPWYSEQIALEEQLNSLNISDLSGYGPSPDEFDEALNLHRYTVDGFKLERSKYIPPLDSPCGQYFTYRDLIECGETQARTRMPNVPKRADSFTALHDLAVNILDPVIEYFGMIKLTYGFCSPELAKEIPGRIASKLDQHAAHEINSRGGPICQRLGAAVDFLVENEDMEEVALWIFNKLPCDRLYYYGNDQPIHISYGQNHSRKYIEMAVSTTGRLYPKIKYK